MYFKISCFTSANYIKTRVLQCRFLMELPEPITSPCGHSSVLLISIVTCPMLAHYCGSLSDSNKLLTNITIISSCRERSDQRSPLPRLYEFLSGSCLASNRVMSQPSLQKTWRKKHGGNFRAFYTASYDRISLTEA